MYTPECTCNKIVKAVGTEPDAAVCDEDEGDGGAVAPLLPDQTLQSLVAIEQYYKC